MSADLLNVYTLSMEQLIANVFQRLDDGTLSHVAVVAPPAAGDEHGFGVDALLSKDGRSCISRKSRRGLVAGIIAYTSTTER